MVKPETIVDRHVFDIIQRTIANKAWYGLSPDGSFNWPISVYKITESLQQALFWNQSELLDIVRNALESAFTPDCLTRVGNESFVQKLSALAKAHDHELIVWTVGDTGWQINKAERTGLFNRGVHPNNFRCAHQNKQDTLLTILRDFRAISDARPLHAWILDDKEENLRNVRLMQNIASALNITIHDFQVKENVQGASPSDAYAYLKRVMAPYKDAVIISDFDGVLANTDQALKERGTLNIYQAFMNHR